MVKIRLVTEGDRSEWLRLRFALWHYDPIDQLDQELEKILADLANQPVFVAERPDGGLCGMVEVSLHEQAPGCSTSPVGYLEGWYVDPDWQGQGIGRKLVEAGEDWARSKGCTEMASDTDSNFPFSPAAHASLGYQEVKREYFFRKDISE